MSLLKKVMSRVALKIENYSSEELKAMLRKDNKFQQGVRLYAYYQVSKGKIPKSREHSSAFGCNSVFLAEIY